jgi:hypothetical protein
MRVFLQSTETGLYLARGSRWTENPEAALAFLDEMRAGDHRIYHRLVGTRVVVVPEAEDQGLRSTE